MNHDSLENLKVRLRDFAKERDWDQFHSPKNLSMALIAETAELVEHFQWLTQKQSSNLTQDKLNPVEQELGDIFQKSKGVRGSIMSIEEIIEVELR